MHYGERQCLFLCHARNINFLLTDDLAVRETARKVGITPLGSVGIVVKAYHLGNISISKAKVLINDLYEVSSLFVTKAIVELAIDKLSRCQT